MYLYFFNSGPFALTKQIILADGFQGLFRGLIPTFAREMPGYFFFFGGYEISRTLFTPAGKTKDDIGKCATHTHTHLLYSCWYLSLMNIYEECEWMYTAVHYFIITGSIATIISGGIGGVALWAAVFPADVIKSRAQVAVESVQLSFVGVFNKILKEEGG